MGSGKECILGGIEERINRDGNQCCLREEQQNRIKCQLGCPVTIRIWVYYSRGPLWSGEQGGEAASPSGGDTGWVEGMQGPPSNLLTWQIFLTLQARISSLSPLGA